MTNRVETLDPEDCESARQMGHRMVDDVIAMMRDVRHQPAWQAVPNSVKETLNEPVPYEGAGLEKVYRTFVENILPYPTGNAHPRFFGWVMGNGTLTGAFADFLASAMNPHVAGYDQAASVVEDKVLDWLRDLIGFPDDSTGLLVSGGTMANINAVLVARNECLDFDVRGQGTQAIEKPLTVYGSQETHSWVLKACELMGLGRNAFRKIPTNENFEIDIRACRREIESDLQSGFQPFCIVGNVGTVNCGAIDDLAGLRELANRFGIWLHLDGAFGSVAAWAPKSRKLVEGQALADSIAFDLHKWGYMPYEVACVLIRKPLAHQSTFGYAPSYLTSSNRGISVDTTKFADRGVQLSRGFRALKVWMSLKEQGVTRIGKAIDRNVGQARLLGALVEKEDCLELLAPIALNIVCLRFVRAGCNLDQLNEINQEILIRIQESGFAVPSHTEIDGKFAIRVCITNHRSNDRDFDELINMLVKVGRQIELS